jgi:hypothetical protein
LREGSIVKRVDKGYLLLSDLCCSFQVPADTANVKTVSGTETMGAVALCGSEENFSAELFNTLLH